MFDFPEPLGPTIAEKDCEHVMRRLAKLNFLEKGGSPCEKVR